jgi:hypothetical protein
MSEDKVEFFKKEGDFIIFTDEEEPDDPTEKYSTVELELPFFLGVFLLAAMLTLLIMYVSRKHDRTASRKEEGKLSCAFLCCHGIFNEFWSPNFCVLGPLYALKSKLLAVGEPQERGEALTGKLTAQPWAPASDVPCDDTCQISVATKDSSESGNDEEMGSTDSICPICSKEFEPGQLVYKSNNPSCRHTHHKSCMDNWLHCQNSCPVCNQAFVLQTV